MYIGDSSKLEVPSGAFKTPYPAPDPSLVPNDMFRLARPTPPARGSEALAGPSHIHTPEQHIPTTGPHAEISQAGPSQSNSGSADSEDQQHSGMTSTWPPVLCTMFSLLN